MTTYRIDEFSGGRDKRPRLFYGKEKNRFKNLDNAYIGKDKKVHRRWPVRYAPGTVTTGAVVGAISIGGVVTYFASKVASPVVTIAGVSTGILQFDELPGHVADRIMDAKLFNGNVVALIRHVFTSAGAVVAHTYMIHVFDGRLNKPTYVEDPYLPTSWGPSLPLHVYRTGTLGAQVDYVPRLGIAAGKLYISRPDKNLGFCAPTNARVWNTRTQTQIINQGEWFYWPNYDTYAAGTVVDTTTLTGGIPRWIVSESYAPLHDQNGWTCYVLEYCDINGMWHQLIEDRVAPTVNGHFQVISTTSRFDAAKTEFGFKIKAPANSTPIYRLRLIAGSPPIVVVSGAVWSNNHARTAGTLLFEDVAATTDAVVAAAPVNNWARLLLIGAPISPIVASNSFFEVIVAPPGYVDPLVAFAAMTGYERYTNLILGWSWEFDNGFSTELHTELTSYLIYDTGFNTIINRGYGFTTNNATQFYRDRSAYELGIAGDGLAGFLPTATRARADGGFIQSISTIKDYLGIHYRTLTLLYAVNVNLLLDTVRDQSALGTGDYVDGNVTSFYNQTILLSERGFRAFSVGGYQSDRADDTNIGEANEQFDSLTTTLISACFWPYTGQYVAIVDLDGEQVLYVFDYSKDSKISAWSTWTIGVEPVVSGPCGLVVVSGRLYIVLASGGIAYFDAQADPTLDFFDDFDLTGATAEYEYPSVAECYQNDFGQSSVDKKMTHLDVTATGVTTISANILTENVERNVPVTRIDGTSYGAKRRRIAMRGFGAALRFESIDRVEWVLDAYTIEFTPTMRQP